MGSSVRARPAGHRDGYFPRGHSVLREVMRERAVGLLYGQRALMIGAMHPVAFIGTTQRSKAHDSPWKRLTHTARMFDAVFFGTRAEADKALAFTRRLHDRVNGEISEAVGPYPEGTQYGALDPKLMLWVVAPTFDSAQVLYETLVRRLSDDERQRLYGEFLFWGELFGMPREAAPPSYREFRRWYPTALASEAMFLSEEARAVGRAIGTDLPTPAVFMPAAKGAGHLLVGTLPEVVREEYGFGWSRVDELAFQAATLAVRRSRWLVPRRIRRGSCSEAYELIARTERNRRRAGIRSFPARSDA